MILIFIIVNNKTILISGIYNCKTKVGYINNSNTSKSIKRQTYISSPLTRLR